MLILILIIYLFSTTTNLDGDNDGKKDGHKDGDKLLTILPVVGIGLLMML